MYVNIHKEDPTWHHLCCMFKHFHPILIDKYLDVKSLIIFHILLCVSAIWRSIHSFSKRDPLLFLFLCYLCLGILHLVSVSSELIKINNMYTYGMFQVMELLVHVNKRVKSRPLVQLPVEALLVQYQDPSASLFVIVSVTRECSFI